MPDLSIIIPIYNTPVSALTRCFHSVESLDPAIRWEVLLIDDGSGAETGDFCSKYAQQHPDFRYIHQENGGVSSARNTGIAHARGHYLTFLDADDTLIPQPITAALLQEEQPLVIFDILLRSGDAQRVWHALERPGAVSQKDLLSQLICSKSLNSPCAKLFRKDIILENGLRFDQTFVTGEDWNFVCDYVLQIRHACYQQTPVYCYYRDAGTSAARLARFPDTMPDNHISMYRRKLELISQHLADRSEDLLRICASDLVENLFNMAGTLLLLKLFTGPRKDRICREAAQAQVFLTGKVSRKTRLKASILKKHLYLLRPVAGLRRLYLKHKH